MRHRRRALAIALVALALLSGCSTDRPAEKSGSGELRTDTAPLTDRFPVLGGLDAASWMSGTFGDGAPGPSTYWIDAVVTLSPNHYADVVEGLERESAETPPVVAGLQLPDGEFERSGDLDAQFSPGQYRTRVYLNGDSRTLVLLSVFE